MSDHADGLNLEEVKRDLSLYTGSYPYTDAVTMDCGVRGRLVMAVPLLVARIERLTREVDLLRTSVQEHPTVERLTRAISDPGSVVAREGRDSDRPESVSRWSARAVLRALQTRGKGDDDR